MSTPSIKKNYIFNVFSQFVSFIIPLVTNPYVSRIFGASGIGISSYTAANVTYFTLFGMLGISGYGQREIAIHREDRRKTSQIFCELQIIHFITFILTGILYFVMALNSPKYEIYYLVQFIAIIASFLDINWFYQAYEKFQFIAIRNCVIRILMMFSTFIFIKKPEDLYIYVLITSLGTFFANFSLWVGIGKYVDFVPIKNMNLQRHIKDIMIFFIPTIAASVYSILDKSVINWITKEEAENGYYEQASKILIIANVFVQSLASVSAPRMSNLFSKKNAVEFKLKLNRSLQYMLLISMPTAFGIAGIAKRFVPVFFGDGFDNVIYILYVFMPMVVVLGFSVYLDGMYLVPAGRRAESAMAVCVGSITNLFLNVILVIYLKSLGAAIATLVTECIVSGIMIYMSREMVDWKAIKKSFIQYFLISFGMFALVYGMGIFIKNDYVCIASQIVAGISVYFIALLMFKDQLVVGLLKSVYTRFDKRKE